MITVAWTKHGKFPPAHITGFLSIRRGQEGAKRALMCLKSGRTRQTLWPCMSKAHRDQYLTGLTPDGTIQSL